MDQKSEEEADLIPKDEDLKVKHITYAEHQNNELGELGETFRAIPLLYIFCGYICLMVIIFFFGAVVSDGPSNGAIH